MQDAQQIKDKITKIMTEEYDQDGAYQKLDELIDNLRAIVPTKEWQDFLVETLMSVTAN